MDKITSKRIAALIASGNEDQAWYLIRKANNAVRPHAFARFIGELLAVLSNKENDFDGEYELVLDLAE